MVCIGRIAWVRGLLLSAVVAGLSAAVAASGQDVPAGSGVVPSVVGLSPKDAKSALQSAGLVVRFQIGQQAPSPENALKVYEQDPPAGSGAARGTAVTATVHARVPRPAESGRNTPVVRTAAGPKGGSPVRVPSLMGKSSEQAKAALVAAGLVPKFQLGTEAGPGTDALTVYAQEPKSGAPVRRGAAVKVTISTRPGAAAGQAKPSMLGQLSRVRPARALVRHDETIDPRSARLLVTATDLVVPAGRVKLELRRTLQLEAGKPGMLGTRWKLNWESTLSQSGRRAFIREADQTVYFTLDESTEQYVAASGEYVVFEANRSVRVMPDGRREIFDRRGRLIERLEPNNNRIALNYDSRGVLSRIDGPDQSFVRFTVDSTGSLTRAESSSGDRVEYLYGPQPPSPDRSADEWCVDYGYDASGALVRMRRPQQGELWITYDARSRVTSRRFSDGSVERFEHDDANNSRRHIDPLGRVTTTTWSPDYRRVELHDASGGKIIIQNNEAGRPLVIAGPTGLKARYTYDALGRTSSVENPITGLTRLQYLGNSGMPRAIVEASGDWCSFEYDEHLNLLHLTVSQNHALDLTLTYDSRGFVEAVQRGDGERHTFTYDAAGRRNSVTDGAGNVSRSEYDAFGNVIRQIDARGGIATRVYDEHNRLTSLTDASGATTNYEYANSGSGQVITITDARKNVSRYTFDVQGRLVSEQGPAGRATYLSYDAAGQLTRLENALAQAYQFDYDLAGQMVRTVNPEGGASTIDYDALGHMTRVAGPTGTAARVAYSAVGLPVSLTDTDGRKRQCTYDSQGRVTSTTDDGKKITRYEYTASGLLARVIPPEGAALEYNYDSAGSLTRIRRGNDTVVTYEYDVLRRCAKEKRSTGLELTYRYDAEGHLVAWQDNLGGRGQFEYDAVGRMIATHNSAGATTRYKYDPVGNLLETTGPLGDVKRRAWNAAGEVTEVVEPNGDTARFDYDRAGMLASVSRPGAGRTTYDYNALGAPVGSTNPLGQKTRSSYDSAGRLMSETDAKGQTTTFTYDQAGRLRKKQLADGKVVAYEYDDRGNLSSVDDGAFPIRYTSDDHDRVVRIEYPAIKQSLSYAYNAAGLRSRFTDSLGRAVDYEYDSADRLVVIKLNDSQAFRFTYDPKSRLSSIQYPNGVLGTWQYDADDRPLGMKYTGEGGKTIGSWSFTNDAAGNRVQIVDAENRTLRFLYDPARQLIEENAGGNDTVKYGYLPGGNRGSKEHAGQTIRSRYDEAGRLVESGDETFAYDSNGNLLERRGPRGVTRFVHDVENRLTKVVLSSGEEVTYGYAATGQRIWRRDAKGLTYFVSDGLNLLAELDKDLKPQASYLHGAGIDRPLMMDRDGGSYYFHSDWVGTIRRLTDASGALAASYEYDSFGQMVAQQGTQRSPFQFTARELDQATGLYYYRARYYDPALGRFLTKDPAPARGADALALNAYAYARNNPIRYVDGMGLESVEPSNSGITPSVPGVNVPAGSGPPPSSSPQYPSSPPSSGFLGGAGPPAAAPGARVIPPQENIPTKPGTPVPGASEPTPGIGRYSNLPVPTPEELGTTYAEAVVQEIETGGRSIEKVLSGIKQQLDTYKTLLEFQNVRITLPQVPTHRPQYTEAIIKRLEEMIARLEQMKGTQRGGVGAALRNAMGLSPASVPPPLPGPRFGPALRTLGKAALTAAIVMSLRRIIMSPNPGQTLKEELAGWGGGIGGSIIGTALLGPVGGLLGSLLGSYAGGWILEFLQHLPTAGGPIYLPPERVTGPTASQPASTTTDGTPVLTPDPRTRPSSPPPKLTHPPSSAESAWRNLRRDVAVDIKRPVYTRSAQPGRSDGQQAQRRRLPGSGGVTRHVGGTVRSGGSSENSPRPPVGPGRTTPTHAGTLPGIETSGSEIPLGTVASVPGMAPTDTPAPPPSYAPATMPGNGDCPDCPNDASPSGIRERYFNRNPSSVTMPGKDECPPGMPGNDDDCPPGMSGNDDDCPPGMSGSDDDDCPPGMSGRDDDDCPPGMSGSDDDCPPGMSGSDDDDCPPGMSGSDDDDCPPGMSGNDDDCPPGMSGNDDDDCPPGMSGNDDDDCPPGMSGNDDDDCPPGMSGNDDDDCPPGMSGNDDDDCPPGMSGNDDDDCPPGMSGNDDDDCPPGMSGNDDDCPPGMFGNDDDCPAGMTGDTGNCPGGGQDDGGYDSGGGGDAGDCPDGAARVSNTLRS